MAAKRDTQIFIYDLTLSEAKNPGAEDLKPIFRRIAKKWVFQLEQGAEGFRHFQIRVNLHERARKGELIKILQREGLVFHPNALSQTSTGGAKAVWTYVMKDDTRLAGPWKDTDVRPEQLPRRLRQPLENPFPWQAQVLQLPFDDRKIHFIVDNAGGAGKSTFAQAQARSNLEDVLYLKYDPTEPRTLYEAIVAKYKAGLEFRDFTVYINIPRGAGDMKEKDAKAFFNLLEMVKDGHMSDRRYAYTEVFMADTRVVVFSNEALPFTDKYLSVDRPCYYRITPSRILVELHLWVPNPQSREDLDQELYMPLPIERRADSLVSITDPDQVPDDDELALMLAQ